MNKFMNFYHNNWKEIMKKSPYSILFLRFSNIIPLLILSDILLDSSGMTFLAILPLILIADLRLFAYDIWDISPHLSYSIDSVIKSDKKINWSIQIIDDINNSLKVIIHRNYDNTVLITTKDYKKSYAGNNFFLDVIDEFIKLKGIKFSSPEENMNLAIDAIDCPLVDKEKPLLDGFVLAHGSRIAKELPSNFNKGGGVRQIYTKDTSPPKLTAKEVVGQKPNKDKLALTPTEKKVGVARSLKNTLLSKSTWTHRYLYDKPMKSTTQLNSTAKKAVVAKAIPEDSQTKLWIQKCEASQKSLKATDYIALMEKTKKSLPPMDLNSISSRKNFGYQLYKRVNILYSNIEFPIKRVMHFALTEKTAEYNRLIAHYHLDKLLGVSPRLDNSQEIVHLIHAADRELNTDNLIVPIKSLIPYENVTTNFGDKPLSHLIYFLKEYNNPFLYKDKNSWFFIPPKLGEPYEMSEFNDLLNNIYTDRNLFAKIKSPPKGLGSCYRFNMGDLLSFNISENGIVSQIECKSVSNPRAIEWKMNKHASQYDGLKRQYCNVAEKSILEISADHKTRKSYDLTQPINERAITLKLIASNFLTKQLEQVETQDLPLRLCSNRLYHLSKDFEE